MSNALATIDESGWKTMKDQATVLVKSGFLPESVRTPEAAMAIMLKGMELGVPPMRAFAQISIINGKPAVGAELLLAKVYERFPNAAIDIIQNDAKAAVIRAARPGRKQVEFRFDLEDAKRAGLTGKGTWSKYPQNMLYWRCVGNMVRQLFPDCLGGASHTPEELGAEVDEEGQVLTVPDAKANTYVAKKDAEVIDVEVEKAAEKKPAARHEIFLGTEKQLSRLELGLRDRLIPDHLHPMIRDLMMNLPITRANLDSAIAEAIGKSGAQPHEEPEPTDRERALGHEEDRRDHRA